LQSQFLELGIPGQSGGGPEGTLASTPQVFLQSFLHEAVDLAERLARIAGADADLVLSDGLAALAWCNEADLGSLIATARALAAEAWPP